MIRDFQETHVAKEGAGSICWGRRRGLLFPECCSRGRVGESGVSCGAQYIWLQAGVRKKSLAASSAALKQRSTFQKASLEPSSSTHCGWKKAAFDEAMLRLCLY